MDSIASYAFDIAFESFWMILLPSHKTHCDSWSRDAITLFSLIHSKPGPNDTNLFAARISRGIFRFEFFENEEWEWKIWGCFFLDNSGENCCVHGFGSLNHSVASSRWFIYSFLASKCVEDPKIPHWARAPCDFSVIKISFIFFLRHHS